jgi:Replication-relaxation
MSGRYVQELRGQYVRRLPSDAELANRAPIVLTERDLQILVAVHVQGLLTTDLVELAFFPSPDGSRSWPSSKAYERLRELWLWGYLERIELPVARVLGGRRPFLYALGQQGVPYVEQRVGTARLPVQPRRLDRLDHVFVDHDLEAAAFWANIKERLRTFAPRVRRFVWLGERELRARRVRVRDPDRGYWLPFLPDAYFEVTYADGRVQCAIVEVDMGTLTLRRFARKIVAFEAALQADVFWRHFKRDAFEVFVLTPSERRLQALQHAADSVVRTHRRTSYFFATLDALDPDEFAEWRWRGLDNELYIGMLWRSEPPAKTATVPAPAVGG